MVNLFGQQPRFVWVLVDSGNGEGQQEVEIPFENLKHGDLVVVMAGQTIPADGTISSGIASIDQRMVTGEAQPAQKGASESVFAGTIVLSGQIVVRVEEAGEETLSAQIGDTLRVNHTDDFDQSIRSRVAVIQDTTVPLLFLLAGSSLPWLGINGALAILWYSLAGRMNVFGPMSMLNFLHICSQKRILLKDGRSLELLSDIDTVLFDKTGTLTIEQPTVSQITSTGALSEDELLTYAAAAEYKQSHPIAKAILTAAAERQLHVPTIDDARYEIGYGVKVQLAGDGAGTIRVGSERFMALEGISIPADIKAQQVACHTHGVSTVMVAIDEQLSGTIELRPTIRPEAREVVRHLQASGKSVTIISGDHEMPTRQLAEELGITQYFANTLPENKADLVVQLQQEGKKVCFVGDGINDAIALKKANVSISLRGATTVATDSAQIVLMDENLARLTDLFEIAEEFKTNIDTGFLITIGPNLMGIAGTLLFGWGYLTAVALGSAFWVPQLAHVMRPLYQHRANAELAEPS